MELKNKELKHWTSYYEVTITTENRKQSQVFSDFIDARAFIMDNVIDNAGFLTKIGFKYIKPKKLTAPCEGA